MSPILTTFGGGSIKGFSATGGFLPGLYDFRSVRFDAAREGYIGPSLAEIKNDTTSPTNDPLNWIQNTTYLNSSGGIIRWKVPGTGTYEITAAGADARVSWGGYGAWIRATFSLTEGELIRILVGQSPSTYSSSNNHSGAGGTFVVKDTNPTSTNSIIIISGGGGGAHAMGGVGGVSYQVTPYSGSNANHSSTSGNQAEDQVQSAGSGGGPGGTQSNGGSGGAGFNATQPSGNSYGSPGYGWSENSNGTNAGLGGISNHGPADTANGLGGSSAGFGGGGAHGNTHGGGGGGYSGGAGSVQGNYIGGGGGSYLGSGASAITRTLNTYTLGGGFVEIHRLS